MWGSIPLIERYTMALSIAHIISAAASFPNHRRTRSPGWEWSVNHCRYRGRPFVFQTEAECNALIAAIALTDPDGVAAGDYSIDGPNEEGTEFS